MDTDVRREAEVIRQVRESDNDIESHLLRSQPATTAPSPNLDPANAGLLDCLDDIAGDEMIGTGLSRSRRLSSSFSNQAMKNSAGAGFWNTFDERMRTPPPASFLRSSSSAISDEMNMDTPASSIMSTTPQQHHMPQQARRSRSSTPQPPSMAAEFTRKIGKRRRDDDLDPYCFKRRAVSPGVSLQNSPILPPSPAQREAGWWALQSKGTRELPGGHVAGERINSGGSSVGSGSLGPSKRIGLQGMNDTNDGLMNMSIE